MALDTSQHEATIASIISFPPQYWLRSVEHALKSVRNEDVDQFSQDLEIAMDLAVEKQARVAGVLKRGLILDPTENPKAFSLMHNRVLARLFIKHPTLCDRLCAKAKNAAFNSRYRADLALFRTIEKYKDRIEEDVEHACQLDEARTRDTGSCHTRLEGVTLRRDTTQRKKDLTPAASVSPDRIVRRSRRKLSSDISKLSGKVTQANPVPNSNISPHSLGPDLSCESDEPSISIHMVGGKHNTITALCDISEESNSSKYTPNQKIDNHPGVRYRTRSAFTKVPNTGEEFRGKKVRFEGGELFVEISDSNTIVVDIDGLAVDESFEKRRMKESDTALEGPGGGDYGQITDMADTLSLIPMPGRGATDNIECHGPDDDLLILDADNSIDTPRTSNNPIDNDAEDQDDTSGEETEHFSLRETIEAMEYIAEHPWACDHALVHHFWDEYKVFQEYKEQARVLEEDEREELREKERRKGKEKERDNRGRFVAAGNKIQGVSNAWNRRRSGKSNEWTSARMRAGVKKSRTQKWKQKATMVKAKKKKLNRERCLLTGRWV